jgi:ketosteroid isomerase-like protein
MKRVMSVLGSLATIAQPVLVAMSLALGGPAGAQAPEPSQLQSVELPPALARVLTDYEVAWQNKDAAALAALFAEDGFVLSSGVPPVRGRAQIQKHYAGRGGPLALRALAFATEGSIGYIIGGFAGRKGDPDSGKFTLTLRKGPGDRWLIMSDMDNGNARR